MNIKPVSRKTDVVVHELENEVLIYDLNINKAYCLNATSALVYQLADGTRTVAEISDLMSVKLKTLVSEDLVWLALDGLKKDNLLEDTNELINRFTRLTRREAVRKVGLASMAMLPVISTLIAPQAAMAASCAGSGAACAFSNYTRSNCCDSNQRCSLSSRCINCYPSSTRLASCQSAGCCNQRSDKNLCCSGSFNETQIGVDYVCDCA